MARPKTSECGGPEQAGAWVALIASGHATADDARRLHDWRAQSAAHEAAFVAATRAWRTLGPALDQVAPVPAPQMSRRGVLTGGVIAALSLGGVGVATAALLHDGAAFVVATGGREMVTLADGSHVALDGGTRMTPQMATGRRGLRLMAGASVVQVAAQEASPFVLRTDGWQANIQPGSEVAVTLGPRSDCVECLSGALDLGGQALHAGQRLLRSSDGSVAVADVPAHLMASWRDGLLVFQDRQLADVIADLNRHRAGRVVIMNPAMAGRLVSGVFHLASPDDVLAQIEMALDLEVMHLGRMAVIT